MEPTTGAGTEIYVLRKVPALPEVAAELRLPSLGFSPLVSELPIAEPLLTAELRPRHVLRGSQREKPLQVRFEFGLRPRLVDLFYGLLLCLLALPLLLLRRL